LTCGIVTCGGLCPGLNNVIRAIVLALAYTHGVGRVLGFRYGYEGLSSKSSHEPLQLTMEVVDRIHDLGGTILGSSRGPQDVGDMVDTLVQRKVGILFTIGGDGTLRGASAISQEIERRRLPISVIGISKTIDNDLEWTTRSFGFATAVQAADAVIVGAHTEALGVWNGVGLVKLMGRHSGFIAAHASLANSDVNFCLVPVTRTGRALTTAGRGR
jgi:6-phosphofructokinase 1